MSKSAFPEKEWLENLVMQEDRDLYATLSVDQKRLIRFAYMYGVHKTKPCETCI